MKELAIKGRGRCPRCGSRKIGRFEQPLMEFYSRVLEVCANCPTAWEPLPPGGDHLDSDGTLFAFSEPCDNCAFRPRSHEQQDTREWRDTIAKLKNGGRFYCHKGVPLDPLYEHGDSGFAYPKKRDGKPNERKLRLCRGYLNMIGRHWAKEFAA